MWCLQDRQGVTGSTSAFVMSAGTTANTTVLKATFKRYHVDPLKTLRKEFSSLQRCKFAEILASNKFAFIFENSCMAEDVEQDVRALQGQEHALFKGELKAVQQSLHIFSVWKLCLEHQRHLEPCLPAHRCMFLSYAMTQEVSNMAANGMTPLAIINHLTKNGRHGMISRHKVDHIRATIETDISVHVDIHLCMAVLAQQKKADLCPGARV